MKDLKMLIAILLTKEYSFDSSLLEIQKEIKNRFNKEYTLDEIEEEMIDLMYDNNVERVPVYPDDAFEGY
jgi:hypothetical protein